MALIDNDISKASSVVAPADARAMPIFVRAGQDLLPIFAAYDPKLISTIGANIEASADRSSAVAACGGILRAIDGTISIEPAIEIAGNVESSSTEVCNNTGSIVVRGDICDLAHLRAERSIFVAGLIDAAQTAAGGDIVVAGGMLHRGKGNCIAGGNVLAKFLSGARIDAGGNVVAQTEINNSNIACSGHLISERGPLIASTVVASAGVRCRTLGCPAFTRALVDVGADDRLRRLAATQLPEIEALRRRAQRMRIVVEPLLRHQKHLTVEGRDKATELLFEAKELAVQTEAMIARLRGHYEQARARAALAQIRVTEMIYPGVMMRFPGMQATLRSPLRGSVTVAAKYIDGQRRIVASEDRGNDKPGNATVLEHEPFSDPLDAALEALFIGPAAPSASL